MLLPCGRRLKSIMARSQISPEDIIRPQIRALSAYHVPASQGLLKLDAMENPYAWPGELPADLLDEWLTLLRAADLNRYPDPTGVALKKRLRTSLHLPTQIELLLGNGSDELIQLLALAVQGNGRVVLAPEPSFVMYRMIALFAGLDYVGVPLKDNDFALDGEAMLASIERHRPVLVFLAYPNNPTGNLFDPELMEAIIANTPGLVIVDEAYAPFTDASFISRLEQFDNLLVMRTLSKMGLAGLRLGYLVGAAHWLHEIDKLRLPYNINTLTQISAEFALRHGTFLQQQAQRLRQERAGLILQLSDLVGFTAYPSEANFILLRTPSGVADRIHQVLLNNGILIKNLNTGLLRDCLRITVGTPEQNQIFLKGLQAALG